MRLRSLAPFGSLALVLATVGADARSQAPAGALAAGAARGSVSVGGATAAYAHAYAVFLAEPKTLVVACADQPLTAAELDRVAVYAPKAFAAATNVLKDVFKTGLADGSRSMLEIVLEYELDAATLAAAGLRGFNVSLSGRPLEWSERFSADPQQARMQEQFMGSTATLSGLAGELKDGGRVRGRLVGSRKVGAAGPAAQWDVAFDAVVRVAK